MVLMPRRSRRLAGRLPWSILLLGYGEDQQPARFGVGESAMTAGHDVEGAHRLLESEATVAATPLGRTLTDERGIRLHGAVPTCGRHLQRASAATALDHSTIEIGVVDHHTATGDRVGHAGKHIFPMRSSSDIVVNDAMDAAGIRWNMRSGTHERVEKHVAAARNDGDIDDLGARTNTSRFRIEKHD